MRRVLCHPPVKGGSELRERGVGFGEFVDLDRHVVRYSAEPLHGAAEDGGDMRKESRNEAVEAFIRAVRGHRVVLDADLARLYGVTTRVLNQAMKRNAERFPSDFAFELTLGEAEDLKSQSVTSSSHGGRRKLPWAFTEHGAIMAANILRSERAVQMSVFVVRAFVRLREQVASNEAILRRLTEIDKTLLQHDTALRDLYQKLLPLLQPRADPPKRRIGFHTGDD